MAKIDILKEHAHEWENAGRLPEAARLEARNRIALAAIVAARLAWERFAGEAIQRVTLPRADEATEHEGDAIVNRVGELAELAEIAWRVRWTVEVDASHAHVCSEECAS